MVSPCEFAQPVKLGSATIACPVARRVRAKCTAAAKLSRTLVDEPLVSSVEDLSAGPAAEVTEVKLSTNPDGMQV